jgi:hypothetical protein
MNETLKERVEAFELVALPGQPMYIHLETANLIIDLWKEVQRLEEQVKVLSNQNGCVVTGKVTYPAGFGGHPAGCQCTGCKAAI